PLRRVLHEAAAADTDTSTAVRARHALVANPSGLGTLGTVRAAAQELVNAPAVAADLLESATAVVDAGPDIAARLAAGRSRLLARSGQLARAEQVAAAALETTQNAETASDLRRVLIFARSTMGDVDGGLRIVDDTLARPGVPPRAQRILEDQ